MSLPDIWSVLKILILVFEILFLGTKIFRIIQSKFFKDESIVVEEIGKTAKSKRGPRKVIKAKPSVTKPSSSKLQLQAQPVSKSAKLYVFYTTLVGSTEKYANLVRDALQPIIELPIEVLDLNYIEDLDNYFVNLNDSLQNATYIFVLPSYEIESPLDAIIENFKNILADQTSPKLPLRKLAGFSVFGLGDSESWPEKSKFCYQAFEADKLIAQLGARRVSPMGVGCVKTNVHEKLDLYLKLLKDEFENPSLEISHDVEDFNGITAPQLNDLEDIAASSDTNELEIGTTDAKTKQMVAKDSPTYKALTKQGYTIVGSHSGVKTCRWTKHALRGRGFCYKYAFYGIRSHLCMETTPALSCSNKCVFCWRHGTNPIGTTWRWEVDDPETILEGALKGHYQKIKQMRGVPGVVADRFNEAFQAKHCALSLVGEPIFYPHINKYINLLHEREISSFLVCNAQHPDQLRQLTRVTQLYVSIDASDKKTLRKIDRPLYRDFWERFMTCLDIIRESTNQRTVYRMTLVKGFNVNEVEGYADLIEKGQPCFVEIKGVTFTGATNPLRMSNVPFYEEVVNFVTMLNEELQARNLDYEIATEHAHSCCILLAHKKFKIEGKWYTHIDFPKFFELLRSGKDFGVMDYIKETPAFAYYGSKEKGFSPEDTRYRKKQLEGKVEAESDDEGGK